MLESRHRDPPSLYFAELAGRSDGEVVRLDDDETRHARTLRLAAGAQVALTDGLGIRRIGRLGPATERRREVVIEGPLAANEPLGVELAIAVGNRNHALWVVEKAAEFGVRQVSPIEDLPDFLARAGGTGSHGIVLDITGEPVRAVLPDPLLPVVLFVGPEAGLTRDEVEACIEAGFRAARLAPTVLRFETAAVAALAGVAQEREMTGAALRAHQGDKT